VFSRMGWDKRQIKAKVPRSRDYERSAARTQLVVKISFIHRSPPLTADPSSTQRLVLSREAINTVP
jgi:hypothetical protein